MIESSNSSTFSICCETIHIIWFPVKELPLWKYTLQNTTLECVRNIENATGLSHIFWSRPTIQMWKAPPVVMNNRNNGKKMALLLRRSRHRVWLWWRQSRCFSFLFGEDFMFSDPIASSIITMDLPLLAIFILSINNPSRCLVGWPVQIMNSKKDKITWYDVKIDLCKISKSSVVKYGTFQYIVPQNTELRKWKPAPK